MSVIKAKIKCYNCGKEFKRIACLHKVIENKGIEDVCPYCKEGIVVYFELPQ